MSFEWNGDEVFDIIRSRVAINVESAADGLALSMKDQIDFACPKYAQDQFNAKVKDKSKKRIGATHAPGGSPPFRETGALYDSVRSKMVNYENPTALVGSWGVEYAHELETGSERVKPHPWCLPTLIENKDNIRERIAGSGGLPF